MYVLKGSFISRETLEKTLKSKQMWSYLVLQVYTYETFFRRTRLPFYRTHTSLHLRLTCPHTASLRLILSCKGVIRCMCDAQVVIAVRSGMGGLFEYALSLCGCVLVESYVASSVDTVTKDVSQVRRSSSSHILLWDVHATRLWFSPRTNRLRSCSSRLR